MRWLTLTSLVLAVAGAILTALYPLERLKNWVGEVRDGAPARYYPDGRPPLWRELLRQPRLLVGIALMAFGFLLQAAGTLLGR